MTAVLAAAIKANWKGDRLSHFWLEEAFRPLQEERYIPFSAALYKYLVLSAASSSLSSALQRFFLTRSTIVPVHA